MEIEIWSSGPFFSRLYSNGSDKETIGSQSSELGGKMEV